MKNFCLNTAEAVDNVIMKRNLELINILSQYRRSSRQCNLVVRVSAENINGLNTAEAVDNVITMITNDLQKKLNNRSLP